VVLRRPSGSIKSPYVSDVIELKTHHDSLSFPLLLSDDDTTLKTKKKTKVDHDAIADKVIKLIDQDDDIRLAHSPSLDCAGMVVAGALVYCSNKKNGSTTKTDLTIQHCEEIREDGTKTRVGYHPSLAETLAKEIITKNLLVDLIGKFDNVQTQVTFGKSRVDFVITNTDEKTITLIEVKNVVGASYQRGLVPKQRNPVGVYEVNDSIRSAIFPHGSVKSGIGVVSDRAIKHCHELTQLVGTKSENGLTIKAAVLFIVNRNDCEQFRPCDEADFLFAQVLYNAYKNGVQVIAQEIIWNHSIASLGRQLPIAFSNEVVSKEIDDVLLSKVLEYNETFKR
jgi:DNA-binding sugar fermentation-stimulating protein